jgi:secernin
MIPKSCDTMVALGDATQRGQTVFAKNSDRPPQECQPLELHPRGSHPRGATRQCQFISLPEVATTWRHVGSRPWWCWGYEHGYNEHQVVIGNEGLGSRLPISPEPRLIGMEILRLGLERASTAAEAVEVVTGLVSRHGQGQFVNDAGVGTYDNGYIVADPHEAYVIETAGHHWAVQRVRGAIGISNVYSLEDGDVQVSPEAERDAVQRGWWESGKPFSFADAYSASSRAEGSGAMRRLRSCTVLQQRLGGIDVPAMMAILSDHSDSKEPEERWQTEINPGSGICVHTSPVGVGGNTAASLVADLCADCSRLPVYWCSFYSPCLGLFLPTFIQGQLPEVLGRGGERASDDSPWWGFHRLSRLARIRGESGIQLVRQTWGELQGQLLESAYATAVQGQRLIDAGQVTEAEALLSGYMADCTAAMLDELAALQRQLNGGPLDALPVTPRP